MTAQTGNNENAERGLLPYPVIIAATKGYARAFRESTGTGGGEVNH